MSVPMRHDAFGEFADISLKFRSGQRPSGNSQGVAAGNRPSSAREN
jgi:hypothetical protein